MDENTRRILQELGDDPEYRRAEEESRQRLVRLREEIRYFVESQSFGSEATTDTKCLNFISELFNAQSEPPFSREYDPLINRLSFTTAQLDTADDEHLRTAWTRLLKDSDIEFDWPLHDAMAYWYTERNMVPQAIAVYEHLYSEIRQGRLHGECPDNFEPWLMELLSLCCQRGLISRARHLCDLIEDFHYDGCVSFIGYVETVPLRSQLQSQEILQAFEADLISVEQRLAQEQGGLLGQLHILTRRLVINAEAWSSDRWQRIEPSAGPLRWSLALESEFHQKVFEPNRRTLESAARTHERDPVRTCGLGNMIRLLENTNVEISGLFVNLSGGQFLMSPDTLANLRRVRDHRHDIAHVRRGRFYSVIQCSEFLRLVRASGWIFQFLGAIQPR